jgi:HlyD family secretion protein
VTRFRVLAGIALVAIFGAGAVWVLRHRPVEVPVARAEQNVPVRVFGLGTMEAQVTSRIGFEVAGALVAVLADHGDRVVAGQVLARLSPTAQQARVAKSGAGLQSAEAQQLRVAAALERATAQAQQKRSQASRRRELAARGNASVEVAELAETEAVIATADLAVARAALADAQAGLLAEQTTLAKHSLAAPYDALVVGRQREPGTALAPGEVVFTLVDAATLWALAYVDEGRAGQIREGQPAVLRLRSLPGETFAARVVRIGLESDRVTEERRIYARCETCPPRIVLGEQVQLEIETGRLPSARLVPETAVEGFDGATGQVWTIEAGALRRREVRFVARTLDARLALDPALPEALAVVTQVSTALQEGRAARPR